ncbi:MAG: thiamine phosphate synthase [Pyrinomonadaceae bacterium]
MNLTVNKPITYLITEGVVNPENFATASRKLLDHLRLAVDEGISMIQIREKSLPTRLLCDLASNALGITTSSSTKLLINDRADVAVAVGADGVHLTANSLPADVIRKKFSASLIIGASVHSMNEAKLTAQQGADFAVFAPVFGSPGKGEPKGIAMLAEICRVVKPFPILALGGVDETNVEAILDAGGDGFAAIRALNDLASLRTMSKMLKDRR